MDFKKIFTSLLVPISLFSAVNDSGDVQFWQRIKLNSNVTKRFSIHFTEESRYGDDLSKFYYSYLQLLFGFQLNQWLSFEPGYRQIYRRFPVTTSHFLFVYDPLLDVKLIYHVENLKFLMRNRVQLLFRGSQKIWVYRALFRLTKKINEKHSIYVDNEFFFREFKTYNQNRTSIGFSWNFSSFSSFDLFYIARILARSDKWVYNNILGCNLNFKY